MNRKLTDRQIEATCRTLLARDPAASGRALRAALTERYGSPGKTDRIFAVWRRLRMECAVPAERTVALELALQSLATRLTEAESARLAALERAQLAELREERHQERWAREVVQLREEVSRLAGEGRRRAELESRLLDLRRELAQLQRRLAACETPASTAAAPYRFPQ